MKIYIVIDENDYGESNNYGNDYEVVDRLYTGYFEGRQSGYLYEDEANTTDVSLLAKEQEQTCTHSKRVQRYIFFL